MDYRAINKYTILDYYSLPLIDQLILSLSSAIVFTKLDIHWGFNNICIKPEDWFCAAFLTSFWMLHSIGHVLWPLQLPSNLPTGYEQPVHLTPMYWEPRRSWYSQSELIIDKKALLAHNVIENITSYYYLLPML